MNSPTPSRIALRGDRPSRERRTLAVGLFFLSAGVLTYELLLMRLFSVLMWYHFASLAIGLALLGIGAGGVAVGLAPRLRNRTAEVWGALGFAAGVLLVLAFLAAVRADPGFARATLAPFHQPFYKPFAQAAAARPDALLALRLAAIAVLCGLPFFGAGLATASGLARVAPRLHGTYAATFLGSAAGACVGPALLVWWSAPAGLGAAAALGLVGAAVLGPAPRGRLVAVLLAGLAIGCGVWAERTGGAEIPFARGRYQQQLLAVRWNPMSRVAAYSLAAGDLQRPPGLSPSYRGPRPQQVGLVVDDSGYTNLFDAAESRANPEYFRANLVALAYHLRPEAQALILGPGGGKDVWIALSFPGTRVRAVEINPQVVAMVQDRFPEFTGRLYADPRVELTVADARRFVGTDPGTYDVVEASAVFGRMPPAAGAFTLSEDLLHTTEAFQDYWRRLGADGILSVTRFAYDQRALRLTALARELLERVGVADLGRHVRVLSSGGLANLLVCRSPFTPEDDAALRSLAARYDFRFLYPTADGPTTLTRLLDDADIQPALDALPYDVSAPTDDRPFFYYTVRPRDFLAGQAPDRPGFDNRGAEILRAVFLVLAALTVATILLPLPLLRGLPRIAGWGARAAAPVGFAALVGLGYMALEIGTMKRLTLFLGHPVYAAAATLFAFLLGSGAGSLWSRRLGGSRRGLAGVLCAAVGFGLLHALFTPELLQPFAGSGFLVRCALAGALVLPLAFALGAAFPTAMAHLHGASRDVIPWAWAANGAASVLGSVGAVLIAMNGGYTATLLTGAGLYAAALATAQAFPHTARGP
ncbi:MAG: hypothetical protein P1P84_12555 [Deferrisomatales bacterium]|nr:hypothetical protein [Deferrisomatales bacterium]